MPRVHGADTDQRRRPHHRAGIFSLSTPFQQSSSASASASSSSGASPRYHNHHNHHHQYRKNKKRSSPELEDYSDDLEFRGSQTQARQAAEVTTMTTTTKWLPSAALGHRQYGSGAAVVATSNNAASSIGIGIASVSKNHSANANGSTNAAEDATRNESNGTSIGTTSVVAGSGDVVSQTLEGQTSKPMTTIDPPSSGENKKEDGLRLLPQQEKDDHSQFEDGMEDRDADYDSDATTLDGSVDLLMDTGNNDDNNTNDNINDENTVIHPQQHRAPRVAMMSPISPATQTLDRLSKFGSQEGGAELCIHLLANAAESHGKIGEEEEEVKKKEEDEEEGKKVEEKRKKNIQESDDGDGGSGISISRPRDHDKNYEDTKNHGKIKDEEKRVDDSVVVAGDNSTKNIQQLDEENTSSRPKTVQLTANDDKNKDTKDTTGEDTTTTKRQKSSSVSTPAIRELKQYFMSTKNSANYALHHKSTIKSPPPSAIPFCHKCKSNKSLSQLQFSQHVSLPHHGLCPYHPDFYDSGSYEILNLVVDGNLLGCEACVYQFGNNGRLNKKLSHGAGCKRGGKKKKGAGGGTGAGGSGAGNGKVASVVKKKDGATVVMRGSGRAGNKKDSGKVASAGTKKNSTGIGMNDGNNDQKKKKVNSKSQALKKSAAAAVSKPAKHPVQLQLKKSAVNTASKAVRQNVHPGQLQLKKSALATASKSAKQNVQPAQLSPMPTRKKDTAASTRPNTTSSSLSPVPRTNAGTSTRPGTRGMSPVREGTANRRKGPFDVGTLVFIEDRTWPGINDPGGVARIVKVHDVHPADDSDDDKVSSDDPERLYDVKYIISRGKSKEVEEEYISLHKDYISPTKDQSVAMSKNGVCDIGGGSGNTGYIEIAKAIVNDTNESDGVKKGAANQVSATANATGGPPRLDENGHPLSEYECLRLRNIQRNEARLEKLGLLAPQRGQQQPSKSNTNRDRNHQSSSSSASERGRTGNNKQPVQEIERRTLPKRHKSKRSDGDGDDYGGKPKPATETTGGVAAAAAADDTTTIECGKRKGVHLPSLAEAAKSGCRKCIDQFERGIKTVKTHDPNCPRKGFRGGSRRRVETDDPVRRQKRPKIMTEQEKVASVAKNVHDLDGLEQRSRQPAAKVPTSSKEEQAQPSLLDAAKAGCRKCTVEWQTEASDPKIDHDICCPRVRKRLPPSAEESRQKVHHGSESKQPHKKKVGTSIPSINPVVSSDSREVKGGITSIKATAKVSKVTPVRVHRPTTPSPAPTKQYKKAKAPAPKQQGPPPPLPTWIQEFISESDQHNETVPAPRGSKWLPCPNPWGKMGHDEGDFVIISPFQSESSSDLLSIFHQGPNGRGVPKRFVANPFEEGSPYHATHQSPANGGYSVLQLKRGRMGLRPWGFTLRLHEFGGACLVDGIEPMSPAEAAEDISGWSGATSSSGLKLHDMILCVNGKSVGSLTMPELQIELDVCGPELMLVVCRFEIQESVVGGDVTLEDLAMDWNDIGAGCDSLKRKVVSFEDEPSSHNKELYELKGHDDSSDQVQSEESGSSDDRESQADAEDSTVDSQPEPSAKCKQSDASTKQSHKQATIPAPKKQASAGKATKKSGLKLSLPEDTKSVIQDIQGHDLTCSHRDEPRAVSDHKEVKSLSKAAKLGCKKCQHEMCTGSKYAFKRNSNCPRYHDSNCPRSVRGAGASNKDRKEKDARTTEPKKNKRTNPIHDMAISHTNDETNHSISQVEKVRGTLKTREGATKQKRGPTKAVSRYQKQLEELSGDESDIVPKRDSSIEGNSKQTLQENFDEEDESSFCNAAEEEMEENESSDENPWLGCVCGKTHPHPIKVFWIQCEGCDAWYNVARECVGFGENEAEQLEDWCCWACKPPVAGLGL